MPKVCYADQLERNQKMKQLRAEGCTYKQIASRLNITSQTVRNVVIYGRLERQAVNPYFLTPAEFAVAKLMIQGLSNFGVAQALRISHRTVENHVAAIYRKLEINHDHAVCSRSTAILMLKEALAEKEVQKEVDRSFAAILLLHCYLAYFINRVAQIKGLITDLRFDLNL